jgi:hypothetical protein
MTYYNPLEIAFVLIMAYVAFCAWEISTGGKQ